MENERTEMIEDRVNAEPVPFTALGIDLDGMPSEIIKLMEDVYRATRRNSLNEHAIELEQMEAEHASAMQAKIAEYNELSAHVTGLEESNRELTNAVDRLEHELAQAIIEKEDALEKRDAAVREMEETGAGSHKLLQMADAEIAGLRAKLEQYEKAAEYQARQDQPISMTAEETNSLQASADAVKKLFARAEDWGSVIKAVKPDGTFERVSRAEFEEDWAPVPPELPSFRSEDTTSDDQDDQFPAPEAPEAVTEDTFQGDVLAGHSADGAGETESFEQEVRRRLGQLESAVFHYKGEAA